MLIRDKGASDVGWPTAYVEQAIGFNEADAAQPYAAGDPAYT